MTVPADVDAGRYNARGSDCITAPGASQRRYVRALIFCDADSAGRPTFASTQRETVASPAACWSTSDDRPNSFPTSSTRRAAAHKRSRKEKENGGKGVGDLFFLRSVETTGGRCLQQRLEPVSDHKDTR